MRWNNIELPDKNIYFQDKDSVIYCADCRDILPLIPDKSIDLVLTDPPFNVGKDYGAESVDDLSQPEYFDLIQNIGQLLYGKVKDISSLLIKIPTKHLPTIIQSLLQWQYKWIIGLYVPNSMKPMSKGFNQLGLVLWYYKIESLKTQHANDVYYHNRDGNMRRDGEKHPNPMDAYFVNRLIADYSNANNLILDPFLGSGTTAYCAKKLGRKCIGIEIEEKYCKIAVDRLSQSVLRLEI